MEQLNDADISAGPPVRKSKKLVIILGVVIAIIVLLAISFLIFGRQTSLIVNPLDMNGVTRVEKDENLLRANMVEFANSSLTENYKVTEVGHIKERVNRDLKSVVYSTEGTLSNGKRFSISFVFDEKGNYWGKKLTVYEDALRSTNIEDIWFSIIDYLQISAEVDWKSTTIEGKEVHEVVYDNDDGSYSTRSVFVDPAQKTAEVSACHLVPVNPSFPGRTCYFINGRELTDNL